MKISDIEVIPIAPKLATRYATRRVDLYGIDCRIVYKVHTDAGINGYGDTRVRPHAIPAKDSVARAILATPERHRTSVIDNDFIFSAPPATVAPPHEPSA